MTTKARKPTRKKARAEMAEGDYWKSDAGRLLQIILITDDDGKIVTEDALSLRIKRFEPERTTSWTLVRRGVVA